MIEKIKPEDMEYYYINSDWGVADSKEYFDQFEGSTKVIGRKILDIHIGGGRSDLIYTKCGKTILRYEWDNGGMHILLGD